jgi:hypothetical protein
MRWNRWYAARSYVLSSLWIAPLIAVLLSHLTFWGMAAFRLDFGGIPGFVFSAEGMLSALDIDITLNLSFLGFALGSLLAALQVGAGVAVRRTVGGNVEPCCVRPWCRAKSGDAD